MFIDQEENLAIQVDLDPGTGQVGTRTGTGWVVQVTGNRTVPTRT